MSNSPTSIVNFFAVLGEEPRVWLEAETLKEKFHRLGAVQHPDRAGGSSEQFSRLNEAYRVLSDPALRLRHFIGLRFPDYAAQTSSATPADYADLFMEIGRLQQQLRQFRERETAAQSPLARALLISEKAGLRGRLQAALQSVLARREELHTELQKLDATQPPLMDDPDLPPRLTAMATRLTILGRWSGQLREAIFTLGLDS
ncbi:MAG: DnaJ domain-containing protein [Chthoniobacteraceae bacterium]